MGFVLTSQYFDAILYGQMRRIVMNEDDQNVVEWIRGKADLKEGLAFPPDFLKRDFVRKPAAKPEIGPGKSDIMRKVAEEKKIPVVEIKVAKVAPKDLKGQAKKTPKADGPVIRVLNKDFGHKPGSLAATKSSRFKDGMTVAEYKKVDLGIGKGWQSGHLKNMVRRGFLKIEG